AGDERGNPIARSQFIDEVAALCGGDDGSSTIVRRIGGEEFIPQASACFSRNEMINAAALAGLLDDPCTEAIAPRAERESILRRAQIENRRESYLALPTREETEDHRADADKAALADHYDGRVHVDVRLRQLLLYRKGAPQAWSSGRFNELAACGFKFFAGRVLMLREEDDPAYEQSALETGDDVHRILHALMRRAPDFSDRSAAMEAAQAVLDEWRRRKEPAAREAAFFRMDCAKIERIVEEFVDYEIARRIAGEGAPAAIKTEHPLRFTLPDARLLAEGERIDLEVEGYIDRLDLYRDAAGLVSRIRVIDYKTARNADNYSKLLREEHFARTDFQLALYVSGALAELKEKLAPEVAIEVGYVVLRSNDKEAVERFPPELFAFDPGQQRKVAASGLEPVAGRLIELASGAVAGRFEVDPRQCDEYCAYRRVCRYNKVFA
ncbi:MAG: PD-(D/E)XK nuclease family protein, partial [Candidatus Binataceae bacterium]